MYIGIFYIGFVYAWRCSHLCHHCSPYLVFKGMLPNLCNIDVIIFGQYHSTCVFSSKLQHILKFVLILCITYTPTVFFSSCQYCDKQPRLVFLCVAERLKSLFYYGIFRNDQSICNRDGADIVHIVCSSLPKFGRCKA